jgi:hypothetical protein
VFLLSSILRWRRHAPRWRPLCDFKSAGRIALVSARCKYSLATVEVMCNRAATFCALVEQEHADTWRWAVYDVDDNARHEGTAPTKAAAKCAAFKALVALDREGVIALTPEPAALMEESPAGHFLNTAVPRILPWRTDAGPGPTGSGPQVA